LVLFPIVVGAAFVPVAVRFTGAARGAIVAVGAVSAFWIYILYAVLSTGAATELMGSSAESSTVEVLRILTKRGWRLVNGLKLGGTWDIDHVVIGTGGVMVIETKWSGSPWPLNGFGPRFMESVMYNAATQARRNANDIAKFLSVPQGSVTAVVVLWRFGRRYGTGTGLGKDKRTVLVHGHSFAQWLQILPDVGVFTPAEVEEVWAALECRVSEQDEEDAAVGMKVVPTVRQIGVEWGIKFPAGSLAAILGVGLVAHTRDWRIELGAPVAAAAVGIWALRFRSLRGVLRGWLLVVFPMAIVLVGVLVYDLAFR
jgi:hypothetical protein